MVFVEDAADSVASGDAEVVEVDDIVRERSKWRGLAEGAVGPVVVVEGLVLGQDPTKVGEVPDEAAVQEFGSNGSVPAFLNRVHDRGPDGRGDDLDSGVCEDGVEGCGELRSAVSDEKPEPVGVIFEVHRRVACHLDGPRGGRVGGGAEDRRSAGWRARSSSGRRRWCHRAGPR